MGAALSCSRVYTVLMTHLFFFFLPFSWVRSLALPPNPFISASFCRHVSHCWFLDLWLCRYPFSEWHTTSSFTTLGHTGGSFTAVGRRMEGIGLVDGEYEGGAEHACLFLFDATRMANCSLCLGFVGSGWRRFCLKSASVQDLAGIWSCGAQKHAYKFTPEPNTFYPWGNETCA
jgi:hypothetical protein